MTGTRHVLAMVAACVGATLCATVSSADDEADIRKTVDAYVAAFNAADSAAVAAHWAEDGQFVTPSGEKLHGKAAIQEAFEAFFKENKGATVEVTIDAIRAADDGTAVERGTARVARPGQDPTETTYVAAYQKQDGKWRLTSIRESDPPPSHYEQLKELEWLIGDWVDKSEDATIASTCQWTKNRNFISRSFAASRDGKTELEGTQVIGWDPAQGVIRSWLFDSDGSFGVGVWTSEGDGRWEIRMLQVLHDGRKASCINEVVRVDENTFQWTSTGREVNGELLPNVGPITIVRKSADN
jgi:uncharacterized protein (TIGR02246 family)